jgi:uncharacterized RDD family membrane protein YckC
MDLREIGWYAVGVDNREYGPFRRDSLRGYLASGVIKPDTQVRHNLDSEWLPAGDVEEIYSGVLASGQGASLQEATKATERQLLKEAEGQPCCGWHPRNKAVSVCHRCGVPICAKCLYKPQMWMCKGCHGSLYNRRTLAGIVDYILIPGALMWPPGIALRLSIEADKTGHGPTDAVAYLLLVLFVALNVLAMVYVLFKDCLFAGRSLGKLCCGLRVVETSELRPCTQVASIKRNSLWSASRASALVPVFGGVSAFLVALWWLSDVSRAWTDSRGQRPFEKWAGTIVLDTPAALAAAQARGRQRLERMAVPLA